MDEKLGKDVQQRLQIIQRKVRDIEASNAIETRSLQEKIDALTQERDALKKNITTLEISFADMKESLTQSVAYHTSMQVALEKEQANGLLVAKERDQLQASLSHMEGLLTASRISGKGGESAIREMQRNYDARVEELEGALRGQQSELRRSKAAAATAQKYIEDAKQMAAAKDAEAAMLQETVRQQCVERALLMQQAHVALMPMPGARAAQTESFAPQCASSQDVMLFSNPEREVCAASEEDSTWKKLKARKKRC